MGIDLDRLSNDSNGSTALDSNSLDNKVCILNRLRDITPSTLLHYSRVVESMDLLLDKLQKLSQAHVCKQLKNNGVQQKPVYNYLTRAKRKSTDFELPPLILTKAINNKDALNQMSQSISDGLNTLANRPDGVDSYTSLAIGLHTNVYNDFSQNMSNPYMENLNQPFTRRQLNAPLTDPGSNLIGNLLGSNSQSVDENLASNSLLPSEMAQMEDLSNSVANGMASNLASVYNYTSSLPNMDHSMNELSNLSNINNLTKNMNSISNNLANIGQSVAGDGPNTRIYKELGVYNARLQSLIGGSLSLHRALVRDRGDARLAKQQEKVLDHIFQHIKYIQILNHTLNQNIYQA